MTSLGFDTTRLRALGIEVEKFKHSDAERGEPSWAHASGWAQLSGSPRRISCVLTCHEGAATLGRLLPDLSDTLTELGFPWELTIIDNASADDSGELLSKWTELPGFHWMRLARNYGHATAAWVGLCHSRGDAVILINVADDPPLGRLGDLIDRWEQGSDIVVLERERGDDPRFVVSWSQDRADTVRVRTPSATAIDSTHCLILLDRRAVDALIASRLGSTATSVK